MNLFFKKNQSCYISMRDEFKSKLLRSCRERKAKHPTGYEPMTCWSPGMCITAVLQLLPRTNYLPSLTHRVCIIATSYRAIRNSHTTLFPLTTKAISISEIPNSDALMNGDWSEPDPRPNFAFGPDFSSSELLPSRQQNKLGVFGCNIFFHLANKPLINLKFKRHPSKCDFTTRIVIE